MEYDLREDPRVLVRFQSLSLREGQAAFPAVQLPSREQQRICSFIAEVFPVSMRSGIALVGSRLCVDELLTGYCLTAAVSPLVWTGDSRYRESKYGSFTYVLRSTDLRDIASEVGRDNKKQSRQSVIRIVLCTYYGASKFVVIKRFDEY